MLDHIAEMIIPEDDTPGAKRAGVAEFIDFMVANRVPVSASRDVRSTEDAMEIGNEAQGRFIAGLDWINARCTRSSGAPLWNAPQNSRIALWMNLLTRQNSNPQRKADGHFSN